MMIKQIKQAKTTAAEMIALVGASLCILIGAVDIIAWIFRFDKILQIDPQFTPMVFNTALSFLLCGAAIVSSHFNIKKLPTICGLAVSALALLTVIQYTFKINFEIDNLVINHHIGFGNPFPGRMAPNTSIGFLFTGAAILLLNGKLFSNARKIIVSLFGASSAALGLIVLTGYFLQFEAVSGWGDYSRMAPTTAAGFALYGISLFSMSVINKEKNRSELPLWLPVPISVAIATAALLVWHEATTSETRNLKHVLALETANISHVLTRSLTYETNGLIRMANRWEISPGTSRELFMSDAILFISHRHGCQGIIKSDADYGIEWAAPNAIELKTKNSTAPGVDSIKKLFNKSVHDETPLITPLNDTTAHDGGLLITIPIYIKGQFAGLIQGIYQADSYFKTILQEYTNVYVNLHLRDQFGNHLSYGALPPQDVISASTAAESELSGVLIRIETWPTAAMAQEVHTILPLVALLCGLLTSVLVGFLIFFYQRTKNKSIELAELNQSLEKKVSERTKTLKESDEFARQWLSNCTDGAWDWDLKTDHIFMTPQFKQLLGYEDHEITADRAALRHLVLPMDLPVAEKALKDHLERNSPYSYELRFMHKNGSILWAVCRGIGIRDENGEITRMVGTLTDITHKKKLEEELTRWAEDLERKNSDLERFNRLAVGREKRMIELKRKINELHRAMGKPEPYKINFSSQAETAGINSGE